MRESSAAVRVRRLAIAGLVARGWVWIVTAGIDTSRMMGIGDAIAAGAAIGSPPSTRMLPPLASTWALVATRVDAFFDLGRAPAWLSLALLVDAVVLALLVIRRAPASAVAIFALAPGSILLCAHDGTLWSVSLAALFGAVTCAGRSPVVTAALCALSVHLVPGGLPCAVAVVIGLGRVRSIVVFAAVLLPLVGAMGGRLAPARAWLAPLRGPAGGAALPGVLPDALDPLMALVVLTAVAGGLAWALRRRGRPLVTLLAGAALLLPLGMPHGAFWLLFVPLLPLALADRRAALVWAMVSSLTGGGAHLLSTRAEWPLTTDFSGTTVLHSVVGAMGVAGAALTLLLVLAGTSKPSASAPRTPAQPREGPEEPVMRLPWVFVAVGGPLGLALLWMTPPYQAADEPLHALLACAIGHGDLTPDHAGPPPFPTTLAVPTDLLEHKRTIDRVHLPFHPQRRVDDHIVAEARDIPFSPRWQTVNVRAETGAVAVYPPAMYLPQASACAAARALGLAPHAQFLALRFANLVAYLACGWLALGWMRAGRHALALILLWPMSLSIAASASGDASLLACVALLAALVTSARPITRRGCVLIVIVVFAVALSKAAYAPLALAPLAIPSSRFTSPRHARRLRVAVVLTAVWGAMLWLPEGGDVGTFALLRGLAPDAAIAARWADPIGFLVACARTLVRERIVAGAVGELGWRDVSLSPWAPTLAWTTLALLVLGGRRAPARRCAARTFGVLGGAAALLVMSFYAAFFTAPTAPTIQSIQGRHLLPPLVSITTALAIALGTDVGRRGRRLCTVVVALVALATGLEALRAVAARFAGPRDDTVTVKDQDDDDQPSGGGRAVVAPSTKSESAPADDGGGL